MYAISKNKRKYSPTPIVRIVIDANGKEAEEIVLISNLPKKDGDALSETIVQLLNEQEIREAIAPKCISTEATIKGSWQQEFEGLMEDGNFLAAMRTYSKNTNCSLLGAKLYVNSIRSKYENKF